VLANDHGTSLVENTVVANPSRGTLAIAADGSFTYTPNAGFSGTDTFTYNEKDATGTTSNTATVTITVNRWPAATATRRTPAPRSRSPPARACWATTSGRRSRSRAWSRRRPRHAEHRRRRVVHLHGERRTSGNDSFTYFAKDPSGLTTNTVTVNLLVKPTALNDAYTVNADTALSATAGAGVLANDLGSGLATARSSPGRRTAR